VMQGRTNPRDLVFAATDTVLGLLFVAAYRATRDIRYEKSHVGSL